MKRLGKGQEGKREWIRQRNLLLKIIAMISFASSSGFLSVPTLITFLISSVIISNCSRSTADPTPTPIIKTLLLTSTCTAFFSSFLLLVDALSRITTRTFLAFGRTSCNSKTCFAFSSAFTRSGPSVLFGSRTTLRINSSRSGIDVEKSMWLTATDPKTMTL